MGADEANEEWNMNPPDSAGGRHREAGFNKRSNSFKSENLSDGEHKPPRQGGQQAEHFEGGEGEDLDEFVD